MAWKVTGTQGAFKSRFPWIGRRIPTSPRFWGNTALQEARSLPLSWLHVENRGLFSPQSQLQLRTSNKFKAIRYVQVFHFTVLRRWHHPPLYLFQLSHFPNTKESNHMWRRPWRRCMPNMLKRHFFKSSPSFNNSCDLPGNALFKGSTPLTWRYFWGAITFSWKSCYGSTFIHWWHWGQRMAACHVFEEKLSPMVHTRWGPLPVIK